MQCQWITVSLQNKFAGLPVWEIHPGQKLLHPPLFLTPHTLAQYHKLRASIILTSVLLTMLPLPVARPVYVGGICTDFPLQALPVIPASMY